MRTMWGNATVAWNEQEIARRESLVQELPVLLLHAWRELNGAVQMERCETPILTPSTELQSHLDANFELVPAGTGRYLRPETTAGTFAAFAQRFPDPKNRRKRLPYCMWQAGLSFREEANPETMRASKLRLRQFHQMEFQLFAAHGSQAPYLETALEALTKRYGGKVVAATELPHYSSKTLDWMIGDLEVAGCSVRTDWPEGLVFEVAIGLDRLTALQMVED